VTTTFFLVRHAAHDLLDRVLVGRMTGVSLSESGREQAQWVTQRLAREGLNLVQSSPQDRARETASPIARDRGLPLEIVPMLDDACLHIQHALSAGRSRYQPGGIPLLPARIGFQFIK